jgi:hypothetical protein
VSNPNHLLSVVLAVHNAEKTLAGQVARLLDLLPDLTSRFELLIVDDGSTDQTEEVAHELARDYPQLRVERHTQRLGPEGATRTAMNRTTGEVVIVHEGEATLAASALRRLWELSHEGRSDRATDLAQPAAITALRPSPTRATSPSTRVHLLHRRSETPGLASGPRGLHADRPPSSFPRLVARLVAQRSESVTTDS